MTLISKSYFLGLFLLTANVFSLNAADMRERDIPAGWDLSATLALFRNLPVIDASKIPATNGNVYFSREEKHSEADGQIFTNTYHFFRKTADGKYLKVSVVEEHRLADLEIAAAADNEVPFHHVSDLSQDATVIDSLPGDAKVRKQLSKLLCYIFDHHKALFASKAGEMGRKLNYKSAGRFRPADY